MKTNKIKLRSGATTIFEVQRWKFDVRCSSFQLTLQLGECLVIHKNKSY